MIYSYFYDTFVIVTIVVSVMYGYKKGFLNGFISVLSCFFSFLFAGFLGKFFLRSSIFGALSSLKFNDFTSNFNSKLEPTKIFGGFSNYLFFWILVFVFLMGFKRFFKKLFFVTGFLKKIPIVNDLDGLLGGIFGALEAAIFLLAVAFICFVVIFFTKNSLKFLNVEVVNSTKLFYMFYKFLSLFKFKNIV